MTTPRQMNSRFAGRCRCGESFPAGAPILFARGDGVVGCGNCTDDLKAADAQAQATVELTVQIDSVRFAKPDGSWTVTKATLDSAPTGDCPITDKDELFSVVGPLGENVRSGDTLRVFGSWTKDPKWGLQFKATGAAAEVGGTEQDLAAFLTRMPGIGQARAREIIRTIGDREKVLDAMSNNPRALTAVKGISEEMADEIGAMYKEQTELVESFGFCGRIGLGEGPTKKAIEAWGADVKKVIEANPYELMSLRGIGFKRADEISRQRLHISADDSRRCAAAILHALELAEQDGHVWTDEEELIGNRGTKLAGAIQRDVQLAPELLRKGIDICEQPRVGYRKGRPVELPPQIVRERDGELTRIYAASAHRAEQRTADNLDRLLAGNIAPATLDPSVFGGAEPHEAQLAAVEAALESAVTVITGGPGVGKTWTVNCVLAALPEGLKVALCAPTGKAAIRITEQTGREASTIHRLLKYNPSMGGFQLNEESPLEADVVIADEVSMVDIRLMSYLVAAVRTGARLIIVGDVDQLPSIQSGRVLYDLIQSGRIPVARLTKIFRQAEESSIPYVARDINEGFAPRFDGPDVRFDHVVEPEVLAQRIVTTVTKARKWRPEDIQVLCPQRKGPIGVEALNNLLQDQLNVHKGQNDVFIGGQYTATKSDRVIHTKNNYDLEVFNGEIGKVVAADADGLTGRELSEAGVDTAPTSKRTKTVLVVDYADRKVQYTKNDARELHLAYAITIHKSQGSQFKAVCIPVHSAHSYMLTRSLLYTAVTRASEFCYCLGEPNMLDRAARNTRGSSRRTRLQERLNGVVNAPAVERPAAEPPAAPTVDPISVSGLL